MLYGITGKAGSGKDTLADSLIRHSGGHKISFADPLKAACRELFQLSQSQLTNRREKEAIDTRWGKSPRQLMQFLGTDLLREQLDKEIFIKSTRCKVEQLLANQDLVIVSDCRFENETQMVRDMGGKVIHLRRRGVASVYSHVSEKKLEVKTTDIVLYNNGTVAEMFDALQTEMNKG